MCFYTTDYLNSTTFGSCETLPLLKTHSKSWVKHRVCEDSVWQGVVGTRVLCLVVRHSFGSGQPFHTALPPAAHPIWRQSHRSRGRGHTSHLNHSAIHSWPDAAGLQYCQISLSDPRHWSKTQMHICTLPPPAAYAVKSLQLHCTTLLTSFWQTRLFL